MSHEGTDAPRAEGFPGVVVSSVLRGLQAHRAAAQKALLGARLHPVAMEHDSARPAGTVVESSLEKVHDAVAYLGIVGTLYGQVPETTLNPDAFSLTELEFREARRLKRPMLIFVMGEDHPIKQSEAERDAGKIVKLTAFRDEIKRAAEDSSLHRVYAEFNTLQQFEIAVTQSVAELRRHLDIDSGASTPPAADLDLTELGLVQDPVREGSDIRWHAVLDGTPPTPTQCALGGHVERGAIVDGRILTVPNFARWLGNQSGDVVYLTGETGDGKTSFVNNLSATAPEGITVCWWDASIPLDFDAIRRCRRRRAAEERGLPGDDAQAPRGLLVIVCSTDRGSDMQYSSNLHAALRAHRSARDGIVLLIEGRPGRVEQLHQHYFGQRFQVAPLGPAGGAAMAALISRAREAVAREGTADTHLDERYPNLRRFLSQDPADQARHLADPGMPLIVRLLGAVYGQDLPRRLRQEYDLLSEPDKRAYLHVCLASACRLSIDDATLDAFVPDADTDSRCRHDPWIVALDNKHRHTARHPLIAQVVLEQLGPPPKKLRRAIMDYVNHPERPRLGVLLNILQNAERLEPTYFSTDRMTPNLRGTIHSEARTAVKNTEDFVEIVLANADGYWQLAGWARELVDLVPNENPAPENGELLEWADRLLAAAAGSADCPDQDRILYYRTRLGIKRRRIDKDLHLDDLIEAVQRIDPLVNLTWADTGLRVDLLFWCQEALEKLPIGRLTGAQRPVGRLLYRVAFSSAAALQQRLTGEALHKARRARVALGSRLVHVHFPDDALDILRDAWNESLQSGNADAHLCTTYVETLLDGTDMRTSTPAEAEIVAAALWDALHAADSSTGELLLLLAELSCVHPQVDVRDLDERIVTTLAQTSGEVERAFAAHAKALRLPDAEETALLLVEAVHTYDRWAGSRSSSTGRSTMGYQLVQGAWLSACQHLQRLQSPKAKEAMIRYRRMTQGRSVS